MIDTYKVHCEKSIRPLFNNLLCKALHTFIYLLLVDHVRQTRGTGSIPPHGPRESLLHASSAAVAEWLVGRVAGDGGG